MQLLRKSDVVHLALQGLLYLGLSQFAPALILTPAHVIAALLLWALKWAIFPKDAGKEPNWEALTWPEKSIQSLISGMLCLVGGAAGLFITRGDVFQPELQTLIHIGSLGLLAWGIAMLLFGYIAWKRS